ncbi:hypothetical protein ACFLT1_00975 [Bacteroidota bacterium]
MVYKKIIFVLLLVIVSEVNAQVFMPDQISVSYMGEFLLHPGGKISVDYRLVEWDVVRLRGRRKKTDIHKNMFAGLAAGMYYHDGYQSGQFIIPQFQIQNQKKSGAYTGYGFGIGALMTTMDQVFILTENGTIDRSPIRNWNSAFVASMEFGKNLRRVPIGFYIEPQLMYSLPAKSTYIFVEFGINYISASIKKGYRRFNM